MQSQQQNLLVVKLFRNIKGFSLLEFSKSMLNTFMKDKLQLSMMDVVIQSLKPFGCAVWRSDQKLLQNSVVTKYFHSTILVLHTYLRKNTFVQMKNEREIFTSFDQIYTTVPRRINKINVRNPLHFPHAYRVPQGKAEEEINKVIAWGKYLWRTWHCHWENK